MRKGLHVLDEWSAAHEGDDKIIVKMETRLRYLRQQPRDMWRRPYFDTLSDDCSGLGEVRFEHKNIQHRIIGFASGEMEYTFVMAAIEKSDRFVPLGTCDIAQGRKRSVVADRSLAIDFDPE